MSVRERVKAAEALEGIHVHNGHSSHHRSHKLCLRTDEHIKEEFLKRSDGGWHKKVDIGQQEKFMPAPTLPPIIKLTVETPIMAEPKAQLPEKVPKGKPATFEPVEDEPEVKKELPQEAYKEGSKEHLAAAEPLSEESKTDKSTADHSDWKRVEQMEAEQQAAIDAKVAKSGDEDSNRVAIMEANQQAAIDAETAKHGDSDWDRVTRMEEEQQAAMDAGTTAKNAAAKDESHHNKSQNVPGAFTEDNPHDGANKYQPSASTKHKSHTDESRGQCPAPAKGDKSEAMLERAPGATTKDVPIKRFEDLLDKVMQEEKKGSLSRSKSREPSRIRYAHVEDDHSAHKHVKQTAKEDQSHREKVLFDPLEWAEKQKVRRERRASRRHANSERLSVDDHHSKEKTRARSPSIRLVRINDDDDDHREHRTHTHPSRSRSTLNRDQDDHEHASPPHSARRSTDIFWPSFSNTERKSMSEALGVRRPSLHRTHSDDHRSTHTADTTHSEISVKKLEFAEYIAGKRLDHIPYSAAPPKSPTRPMGFVRSHSHTGEYSEGYTREKKLLRKPSDDEEISEHLEHDWEKDKKHRRNSSRHERPKHEPWQLKLLSGIARG